MLERALDRPTPYRGCLVRLAGSVTAGLFLSQAIFWIRRTRDLEGWPCATQADSEAEGEATLSCRERKTDRRKQRNLGSLKEPQRDVPCPSFVWVNVLRLAELWGIAPPRTLPANRTGIRRPTKAASGKEEESQARPASFGEEIRPRLNARAGSPANSPWSRGEEPAWQRLGVRVEAKALGLLDWLHGLPAGEDKRRYRRRDLAYSPAHGQSELIYAHPAGTNSAPQSDQSTPPAFAAVMATQGDHKGVEVITGETVHGKVLRTAVGYWPTLRDCDPAHALIERRPDDHTAAPTIARPEQAKAAALGNSVATFDDRSKQNLPATRTAFLDKKGRRRLNVQAGSPANSPWSRREETAWRRLGVQVETEALTLPGWLHGLPAGENERRCRSRDLAGLPTHGQGELDHAHPTRATPAPWSDQSAPPAFAVAMATQGGHEGAGGVPDEPDRGKLSQTAADHWPALQDSKPAPAFLGRHPGIETFAVVFPEAERVPAESRQSSRQAARPQQGVPVPVIDQRPDCCVTSPAIARPEPTKAAILGNSVPLPCPLLGAVLGASDPITNGKPPSFREATTHQADNLSDFPAPHPEGFRLAARAWQSLGLALGQECQVILRRRIQDGPGGSGTRHHGSNANAVSRAGLPAIRLRRRAAVPWLRADLSSRVSIAGVFSASAMNGSLVTLAPCGDATELPPSVRRQVDGFAAFQDGRPHPTYGRTLDGQATSLSPFPGRILPPHLRPRPGVASSLPSCLDSVRGWFRADLARAENAAAVVNGDVCPSNHSPTNYRSTGCFLTFGNPSPMAPWSGHERLMPRFIFPSLNLAREEKYPRRRTQDSGKSRLSTRRISAARHAVRQAHFMNRVPAQNPNPNLP
jgi:hypothetical protein